MIPRAGRAQKAFAFPTLFLNCQEIDCFKQSIASIQLYDLISGTALVQNAGVVANQRVGYGGGFASEPLLQPAAEAMSERAGTLLEKSFRQIESAVL